MKTRQHPPPRVATIDLLVQPDGQILAHNLTPALAAVLAELNPADQAMQQRAQAPDESTNSDCATRRRSPNP